MLPTRSAYQLQLITQRSRMYRDDTACVQEQREKERKVI